MKKLLLLSAIALFSLPAKAQPDSLKWIKEINEQVWKPFIAHLTSGNQEGFRNVHSKRVTRVEIDRKAVLDYEKYFPPIDPNAAPVKKTANLYSACVLIKGSAMVPGPGKPVIIKEQ